MVTGLRDGWKIFDSLSNPAQSCFLNLRNLRNLWIGKRDLDSRLRALYYLKRCATNYRTLVLGRGFSLFFPSPKLDRMETDGETPDPRRGQ